MPIVHLTTGLAKVSANQIVEILADAPGFEKDIRCWCEETKNELLLLRINKEDMFVVYVKKR